MKLKLGIVYTNNTHPKIGYLVFVEEELYSIKSITDESIVLKGVFDNSTMISSHEELCDKYIKFIAIHEKIMYPIINGDYHGIIKLISNVTVDPSDESNQLISLIINNKYELMISGSITKIYCRANEHAFVEITNLNIIDANNLLDKSSRLFKITEKKNIGINTRYIIKCNTKDLILDINRESFKLVGTANYKSLFTIKK